jgi:hypothetical protein
VNPRNVFAPPRGGRGATVSHGGGQRQPAARGTHPHSRAASREGRGEPVRIRKNDAGSSGRRDDTRDRGITPRRVPVKVYCFLLANAKHNPRPGGSSRAVPASFPRGRAQYRNARATPGRPARGSGPPGTAGQNPGAGQRKCPGRPPFREALPAPAAKRALGRPGRPPRPWPRRPSGGPAVFPPPPPHPAPRPPALSRTPASTGQPPLAWTPACGAGSIPPCPPRGSSRRGGRPFPCPGNRRRKPPAPDLPFPGDREDPLRPGSPSFRPGTGRETPGPHAALPPGPLRILAPT